MCILYRLPRGLVSGSHIFWRNDRVQGPGPDPGAIDHGIYHLDLAYHCGLLAKEILSREEEGLATSLLHPSYRQREQGKTVAAGAAVARQGGGGGWSSSGEAGHRRLEQQRRGRTTAARAVVARVSGDGDWGTGWQQQQWRQQQWGRRQPPLPAAASPTSDRNWTSQP
ncbi:hypothetical protein Taro_011424 [Colocasia esculenta]|uniref:Uncharacterized protein n=1 Tax=Colocasia esculenta TaxID=4460 RepID=A0A843U1G2_COLES|nr:hypothetical protein [Colocasia esculenta]